VVLLAAGGRWVLTVFQDTVSREHDIAESVVVSLFQALTALLPAGQSLSPDVREPALRFLCISQAVFAIIYRSSALPLFRKRCSMSLASPSAVLALR
jgi:hypothetical protein